MLSNKSVTFILLSPVIKHPEVQNVISRIYRWTILFLKGKRGGETVEQLLPRPPKKNYAREKVTKKIVQSEPDKIDKNSCRT